jgi:hypothetical protein
MADLIVKCKKNIHWGSSELMKIICRAKAGDTIGGLTLVPTKNLISRLEQIDGFLYHADMPKALTEAGKLMRKLINELKALTQKETEI